MDTPKSHGKRKRPPTIGLSTLQHLYVTLQYSCQEIATITGCTYEHVRYSLKEHGIPLRSRRDASIARELNRSTEYQEARVERMRRVGNQARAKATITRAERYRQHPSRPERQAMRVLTEEGFQFEFQHPIGLFIVDFLLSDGSTVIEIDSSYHRELRKVQETDARKDQFLKENGYSVVRIPTNCDSDDAILREELREAILAGIQRFPSSG